MRDFCRESGSQWPSDPITNEQTDQQLAGTGGQITQATEQGIFSIGNVPGVGETGIGMRPETGLGRGLIESRLMTSTELVRTGGSCLGEACHDIAAFMTALRLDPQRQEKLSQAMKICSRFGSYSGGAGESDFQCNALSKFAEVIPDRGGE